MSIKFGDEKLIKDGVYKYIVSNPFNGSVIYSNDTADIASIIMLWGDKKEFGNMPTVYHCPNDREYLNNLKKAGYVVTVKGEK